MQEWRVESGVWSWRTIFCRDPKRCGRRSRAFWVADGSAYKREFVCVMSFSWRLPYQGSWLGQGSKPLGLLVCP